MTKRKSGSARFVAVGGVSLVVLGAFIAACGLDDTVIDETQGGGSGNPDATIGSDGSHLDGTTILADGNVIVADSGTTTDGSTVHIGADASELDADLSEASVADGGCTSSQYSCTVGGSTYCLDDCSICVGLNYACERGHTCVDKCADCDDRTECFRTGITGQENHCVENAAYCSSSIGGSHVFCGEVAGLFYVDCPGVNQVCVGNECLTCGETGTTGNACSPSASGTCKNPGPACQ